MIVEERDPIICARCWDDVEAVFPANCVENPVTRPGGMYHCPECGTMVLAGVPHFKLCRRCINRQHPLVDRERKVV